MRSIAIAGHVGVEQRPPDYPAPMQLGGELVLHTGPPPAHEDVTVLVKAESFRNSLQAACADMKAAEERKSLDFGARVGFEHNGGRVTGKGVSRVHAALAFEGRYFSVTIRDLKLDGAPAWQPDKKWERPDWQKRLWTINPFETAMLCCPGMAVISAAEAQAKGFLTGQHRLGEILYEGIFGGSSLPRGSGLVLVTGATASGKTRIMNFMIVLYLCGLYDRGIDLERRPHVVALGDPVETVFYQMIKGASLEEIAEFQQRCPLIRAFDFTARVLGRDVASVPDALRDALRETPSAYVISELRTTQDFEAALQFAATGHLVFATAHSTSLVDAMAKLIEVFRADTPSGRSALAQRLKAVVHIRPVDGYAGEVGGRRLNATLPSMWVGDSIGVRNFVSDGLASLLPRGKSAFTTAPPSGVRGLAYSAESLKELEGAAEDRNFTLLVERAHALDLER